MLYKTIDDFIALERARIKQRRVLAGVAEGDPKNDAVGLGLSGGGIRSATFNLGVLQAMQRYGVLREVDYLSTVSGGGYIGSSLTWFMSQGGAFPFGSRRADHNKTGGTIIAWLRDHANYLTPGDGVDGWALAAAILRGIVVNLLILLPVFFALIYFMVQWVLPGPEVLAAWPDNAFTWVFVLGVLSLALLLPAFVCYALCSSANYFSHAIVRRQRINVLLGRLLRYGIACCAIGAVPIVHQFLEVRVWPLLLGGENYTSFSMNGTVSLISGGVSVFIGWLGRNRGSETSGIRHALLMVGLALSLYGLVLWLYNGAFMYFAHLQTSWGYLLGPGLVLSALMGVFANINHVSMHRYYRDRLVRAFMPEHPDFPHAKNPDRCFLKDIGATSAPYPLINTNLVTLDSRQLKFRGRGADNFVFSPLVCGSEATGYALTTQYRGGRVDLGTAFTISGAAVNPNTGMTRSRPLAMVMSLLNVRLGYWTRNPAFPPTSRFVRNYAVWHMCALREMFGLSLDETRKYVHLSDGGHFENLGLYELVRRRCRTIIICDAGADPHWTFEDLANATEKVRVDFGAAVEIDTRPLRPKGEPKISASPFVVGRVRYVDGTEGRLLYLTTCVIAGLTEDIYGYRRTHPAFPDEPTTDQFFDEAQFEAYRELGYQIGRRVFEGKSLEQVVAR